MIYFIIIFGLVATTLIGIQTGQIRTNIEQVEDSIASEQAYYAAKSAISDKTNEFFFHEVPSNTTDELNQYAETAVAVTVEKKTITDSAAQVFTIESEAEKRENRRRIESKISINAPTSETRITQEGTSRSEITPNTIDIIYLIDTSGSTYYQSMHAQGSSCKLDSPLDRCPSCLFVDGTDEIKTPTECQPIKDNLDAIKSHITRLQNDKPSTDPAVNAAITNNVMIIPFADEPYSLSDITPDGTDTDDFINIRNNPAQVTTLLNKLDSIYPSGLTNVGAALKKANDILSLRTADRKFIILVTDYSQINQSSTPVNICATPPGAPNADPLNQAISQAGISRTNDICLIALSTFGLGPSDPEYGTFNEADFQALYDTNPYISRVHKGSIQYLNNIIVRGPNAYSSQSHYCNYMYGALTKKMIKGDATYQYLGSTTFPDQLIELEIIETPPESTTNIPQL